VAHDISEQIGYRSGQADYLEALGDLAHARNQDENARHYYLRARGQYRKIGALPGTKTIEQELRRLSGDHR
jgi:hypothetical protein